MERKSLWVTNSVQISAWPYHLPMLTWMTARKYSCISYHGGRQTSIHQRRIFHLACIDLFPDISCSSSLKQAAYASA